jgi:hypothetical protein
VLKLFQDKEMGGGLKENDRGNEFIYDVFSELL